MPHSPELSQQLADALSAKGLDYRPRTHHLDQGKPLYINRLIMEDSPYLLQHAHNPVDWFPWGEEAFEQARLQNKPIFLSIGYATCHWCHVMEEESFESTVVSDILNQHFIAVKVDREQYPDIDQAYMTAVQMLTGRGGWPMSSFLTPAGKPFFGGTYYPVATFIELLTQIHAAWGNQRELLLQQAQQISDAVDAVATAQQQIRDLDHTVVQAAVDRTLARYDARYGGFSGAPKFPNEPLLLLLLQSYHNKPNSALLKPIAHTLSAMAQGGIYDQVGGGFHRYSVDDHWLVPHFEKMLYNQAYLSAVYSRGYRMTGHRLYARVVRQTLDYALREMATSGGMFYSATDADSEGHEGTYFVWPEQEIRKLMQPEDAEFIIELFGVTKQGNFEGNNILYLPIALDAVAGRQGISLDELLARLDPLLQTLRHYRAQRPAPLTDTKIIVAWNAMLIAALVEAADSLDETKYLEAAVRAARSLWNRARPSQGTLWRVILNDRVSIPARQDDYVHFSEALLALYDATGEPHYLAQARELAEEMRVKFTDTASGALVMGRDNLLFTHPKDAYDGALPSGNAVAVGVLSRLAVRTGDARYLEAANRIVRAFADSINRHPEAYAYLLAQLDQMQHGESGSYRFAAGGAVKIKAVLTGAQDRMSLNLDIAIREGWHINGSQPLPKNLAPTEVRLSNEAAWHLVSIEYPEAELRSVEFDSNPLALYHGSVPIRVELSSRNSEITEPVQLNVQLQACSQEACLPPEVIRLTVFPKHDVPK